MKPRINISQNNNLFFIYFFIHSEPEYFRTNSKQLIFKSQTEFIHQKKKIFFDQFTLNNTKLIYLIILHVFSIEFCLAKRLVLPTFYPLCMCVFSLLLSWPDSRLAKKRVSIEFRIVVQRERERKRESGGLV